MYSLHLSHIKGLRNIYAMSLPCWQGDKLQGAQSSNMKSTRGQPTLPSVGYAVMACNEASCKTTRWYTWSPSESWYNNWVCFMPTGPFTLRTITVKIQELLRTLLSILTKTFHCVGQSETAFLRGSVQQQQQQKDSKSTETTFIINGTRNIKWHTSQTYVS